MSIYEYIEIIAHEKNLTIKQIEAGSGLNYSTIGKWKVSIPKVDMLFKVARFLELPIEYFLTGERAECSPQEEVVLSSFRSCDEEGKARIIQAAMNERDRTEKKKTDPHARSVG